MAPSPKKKTKITVAAAPLDAQRNAPAIQLVGALADAAVPNALVQQPPPNVASILPVVPAPNPAKDFLRNARNSFLQPRIDAAKADPNDEKEVVAGASIALLFVAWAHTAGPAVTPSMTAFVKVLSDPERTLVALDAVAATMAYADGVQLKLLQSLATAAPAVSAPLAIIASSTSRSTDFGRQSSALAVRLPTAILSAQPYALVLAMLGDATAAATIMANPQLASRFATIVTAPVVESSAIKKIDPSGSGAYAADSAQGLAVCQHSPPI